MTSLNKAQPVAVGMVVQALDSAAGYVRQILRDPSSQQVVALVVCDHPHHLRASHDVVIPIDLVARTDGAVVQLSSDTIALRRLPVYRPDAEIGDEVYRALQEDEVIHVADRGSIDVEVVNGIVTLRGYVAADESKSRAEARAGLVTGVRGVRNQIVADGAVVDAVELALQSDPRTAAVPLIVWSFHGFVTLQGAVPDRATYVAIEDRVATVPIVREIENRVQAPGVAVPDGHTRDLQPRIGQAIFTPDGYAGQVERVVVNPHSRALDAIVARGRFDRRPDPDAALSLDAPPPLQRQVVIPVAMVQWVAPGAVLLGIDSGRAAQCPDLDLEAYVAPPAPWQPPYPYEHDDVLVASGRKS